MLFFHTHSGHKILAITSSCLRVRLRCREMGFCSDLLKEMVWSGGSDAAADYTEIRRLTSNLASAVWALSHSSDSRKLAYTHF